jgi:hypothetical protein
MVFFGGPRDIVKLRTPKVQLIVAVADQLWTDQGRGLGRLTVFSASLKVKGIE